MTKEKFRKVAKKLYGYMVCEDIIRTKKKKGVGF